MTCQHLSLDSIGISVKSCVQTSSDAARIKRKKQLINSVNSLLSSDPVTQSVCQLFAHSIIHSFGQSVSQPPTNPALKMKLLCSFETLVPTYKSTRRHNSEHHHGVIHCRENLKPHPQNSLSMYWANTY
jgi:hypothetical protein